MNTSVGFSEDVRDARSWNLGFGLTGLRSLPHGFSATQSPCTVSHPTLRLIDFEDAAICEVKVMHTAQWFDERRQLHDGISMTMELRSLSRARVGFSLSSRQMINAATEVHWTRQLSETPSIAGLKFSGPLSSQPCSRYFLAIFTSLYEMEDVGRRLCSALYLDISHPE